MRIVPMFASGFWAAIAIMSLLTHQWWSAGFFALLTNFAIWAAFAQDKTTRH